jgi:hypothetical protein
MGLYVNTAACYNRRFKLGTEMILDEVIAFYGTSYNFQKITKMSHDNYRVWKRKGYIPILTQFKLEELSRGKLKADYKHGEALKC